MSDDKDVNWDSVDSDWVAEHRPDKLSEVHRQRLILKHGSHAGNEKFQNATLRMLGRTKIAPPYRGGR